MAKKSTSKKKVAKKATKRAAKKIQPEWMPPVRDYQLDLPSQPYYGNFSL